AAALRRADVVVVARPGSVNPLDEHHRRVVRLLHLHVTEVGDRLLVQRPVIARRRSRATHSRSARSCVTAGTCTAGTACTRKTEAGLMTGVASIGHHAA